MNRTVKYILLGLAAVGVGIGAFLLIGSNRDAYLNTLPHDVQAIGRFDVGRFFMEAPLTATRRTALINRILDGKDVDATGIDFSRPVYGFVSKDGYFGASCKVKDKEDLTLFLSNVHEGHSVSVQQQRGYSWAVIDRSYLMAFDSNKALVMGPAVGAAQDQLRGLMYRYMEQGKKESAIGTPLFNHVNDYDEPLAAVLTSGLLPYPVCKTLSPVVPSSVMERLLVGLTAEVEEQAVIVETNLLTDDAEVQRKINDVEEMFQKIDGQLLDESHENAAAWACIHVEGNDVLQVLRKVPVIRTALIALNLTLDADQIIKAIDGDLALEVAALPGTDLLRDKPLCLTVQLNNTKFLDNAGYWLQMSGLGGLSARTPTDFKFGWGHNSIYFGTRGRNFYATNQESLSTADGNAYLLSRKDEVKGKRLYATVDASQLTNDPNLSVLANYCTRINLSMKKLGECKFEILLKNE